MKKFAYVIAALATIAIAAPSIASAETIVVKHGGMHRDHGHPHHDRMVVIRHGHHRHGY
jgi:TRAP-type C4-dicarboxylate transport system substrate-binding protein